MPTYLHRGENLFFNHRVVGKNFRLIPHTVGVGYISYYNLVCVQQIDDIYWVTQIYCEKYLEEDNADKFEGWISSIKHKTNAA